MERCFSWPPTNKEDSFIEKTNLARADVTTSLFFL
jgi:hypothetical protein